MISSALFFFLKIALVIWSPLWFHTNLKLVCSISVKNVIGILVGICIDSVDFFGEYGHFNNILTIYEHGIYLFICVFFDFFHQCLIVSFPWSEVKWQSLSRVWLFAIPWTIQPMEFFSQNTGMGSLSLLQGIFPTQVLNPGFPHCRRILYQLNHKRSPRILEWSLP